VYRNYIYLAEPPTFITILNAYGRASSPILMSPKLTSMGVEGEQGLQDYSQFFAATV